MDIQMLTDFLMWCTIINTLLMIIWTLSFFAAPDLLYKTQRWIAPLKKEQINLVLYGFLAVFKIFIIIFNLVPFLALKIIA